jgi:hypothetical protein
MNEQRAPVMEMEEEEEAVYCEWHPNVETSLRCYQCNTPICAKCAQRTPVGYICPNCRKGRKRKFEKAGVTDYAIAAVISLVLGAVAGVLLPMLGWFTIYLSPLAGTATAEAVWRVVGRRYGRHLWWIVAAGLVMGGLPQLLFAIFRGVISVQSGLPWGAMGVIWPAVHIVLAAGSATARLRLL